VLPQCLCKTHPTKGDLHKDELAKTTIGEGTMWRAYPNPNPKLRVMAQGRLLDIVGPKIREAQGSKPSPAQSTKSFSYKKAYKGLHVNGGRSLQLT